MAAAAISGTAGHAASAKEQRPDFIVGQVDVRHYGPENDLLTAGLGWSGIAGSAPPVSNPPTRDELRRLAIYNNMRGLISTSPTEGFGTIYGRHGPVPGTEYMAFVRGPDFAEATVLVQIPDDLNRDRPCIITAPSSGSRGIYGAISNAEVAFENGCVVAYTDKGTGIGYHDLTRDLVYDLVGNAGPADEISPAHFEVEDNRALERFETVLPNRIAMKHAHSRRNPERNWGKFVLQSIEFAFWAVNDHLEGKGRRWAPENVHVVAAGVSNGGGAALLAAEQDRRGLVDAVVVSEPQVQPRPSPRFAIVDRGTWLTAHSRSLFDVTTFMDVYADCAGVTANPVTPGTPGAARCLALKARGLLSGLTLVDQIVEARARIHGIGLLPDADRLLPAHANLHLWRILAPVYGNAYARAAISDHLCKTSFAATAPDGTVVLWDEANVRKAFATGNGLPAANPAAPGVAPQIIDDTENPPRHEVLLPDLNLDGALCWRALATRQIQPTVQLPSSAQQRATRAGIAEVRATGDLQGKPALILHGRKDALIAPNHSSRAYFGLNRAVEGRRSKARYIEVTNGNHFDAFIPVYPLFGVVGETLVAMHGYFNQSVDRMLDHLESGAPLPQSQAFAAVEETCAVPITPAGNDRIRFDGRNLVIPQGGVPAGC